jgi:ATP synthase protein I
LVGGAVLAPFAGQREAGLADQSGDPGPSENPGDRNSIDDLDARLNAARARETKAEGGGGQGSTSAGLGIGLRIGVEMVSAIAVGSAIGWGLDRWLGTKPWLMVLFFFLGAAAGILNAYRASQGMDDSVGFGAAQKRRSERGKREQ